MEKNSGLGAAACRLGHQRPTSDEVGMEKNSGLGAAACRLEHQRPTSYEVGMSTVADAR